MLTTHRTEKYRHRLGVLESGLSRSQPGIIPNARQGRRLEDRQPGLLREMKLAKVPSLPDIAGITLTKPSSSCSFMGEALGRGALQVPEVRRRGANGNATPQLLSCESRGKGLTSIVLRNQRTMETLGN